MKRYLFLLLICLLSCPNLLAQQMEALNRLNDEGYNYWFYTPDTTDTQKTLKPLIVFLHGQSLCGRNINDVLRYGTLDALRRGREIDSYVVAPQNPGGRWDPKKVIDLVDWAIDHYSVDSCRVYVLGMSLGGFGTINVASTYPDRFAAAMALCGGGNDPNYENLCKIPLWILHGTADKAVKIRDSEEVVQGMNKVCKPERMMFDRLKGKNHSILARIFYMPQTYQWLFSHSLSDSARVMNRDYSIVDKDFTTAYNDLTSPSWQKIKLIRSITKSGGKNSSQDEDYTGTQIHRVRQGDTLSAIARRYHTSVSKLCRLNGIKETSILRLGQKIKVR